MSNRILQLLVTGAAAFVLSGCAVRSAHRTPAPQLPASYTAADRVSDGGMEPAALATWWREFDDGTLNSLVDRAIAGNLDLKIARERVREARAARSYTSATRRLPDTGLSGGFSDGSRSGGLFQSGFDTRYELDLFGGARASVQAAEADAQASEEAVRNTLVTVVAETARNYLELREAQERLAFSNKTLAALQESLRLAEIRRDAGLTSNFDAIRAKAQVESTRAGIPLLEAQIERTINAVALLVGSAPEAVRTELAEAGELPSAPDGVPVGLPSDLLRRRPDIREAERQIAASAARVGAAVSNLYPKFSLTTGGGGQSSALMNLLSGAARLWNFGSSFSWGLLNYPATKANITAAESREQQSMIHYERAVLTALKDVEDALANYTKERERRNSLDQAVQANREALNLASIRYQRGLSNYLDVLDAQRSLYSAEDALVQHRANMTTHMVALYKALGGGW
jgi:NodT family efflux transporter outer membrane factor (OMF) lipoprotein